MSYIFGGNTGVTPEQLDRKRRIAEALMAQNVAPRTAWDGLGNAARSISAALIERGAGRKEDAARQAAQGRFDALFAPQQGQAPQMPQAAPVAAPAAVRGQPEPMAFGNRQGTGAEPNEALIQAIIQQESGGNPNAVSLKGARGMMQIMPATARDPGYGVPDVFTMARQMGREVPDTSDGALNKLLADPEVNEAFGRRYFDAMGAQFPGDRAKQLAAYNAGPGAVEKHGGVPPYQETQDYVQSIESRLGGAQAGAQSAPVGPAPQQGGQPQGPDAIPTQALMQAYGDPFLAPEQREIIGMMLQQRMQQPEQMTPYQQESLALRRAEMDAKNNRGGFRNATPEEAQQYGAPAGQFGPDGRFYPINPPSGMSIESDGQGGVRVVQGPGASARPFTEGQSKDNVFATRAQGALEAFEPVAGALTSYGQQIAGADPTGVVRGAVQSPEYQMAQNAGNEFLQAILRKDTGAAITEQEQVLYGRTYLPQPGDGPEVLQFKATARKRALEAIKAGMSPAQIVAQERALMGGQQAEQPADDGVEDLLRKYGG